MGTVYNVMPGGTNGNFLELDDISVPSPRVVATNSLTNEKSLLEIQKINFKIEIHMSTAFVTIEGTWKCSESCHAVFEAPMNQKSTATSCSATFGNTTFESEVVSRDEVEKYAKNRNEEYSRYNPDIFRFPFAEVQKGQEVNIVFVYFEFLNFKDGGYHLRIPMTFEHVPQAHNMESIISLNAIINSGTNVPMWSSENHILFPTFESQNRYELYSDKNTTWPNMDFSLSYKIAQNDIACSVLYQEPSNNDKGSFAVFVSPPEVSGAQFFRRRVVFILDKSGSMNGQPMEYALNAVSQGINTLNESDFFTVIAFSENQYFFSTSLVPANTENTSAAITWTQRLQASGLTDIQTPLTNALDLLESSDNIPETMNTIPSIFLITDGAVENERDICSFVKSRKSNVRINTFGIGVYCNHYFLKLLASIGRGYCEVAFKTRDLYYQMVQLLNMTSAPVLSDVKIGIASTAFEIEITPSHIPDLFCGAPIVISGSYYGYFPTSIFLMGTLSNGEKIRREIPCRTSDHIPVQKVSVKQKLDSLVAQAWLTNSNKIKSQAVELSCQESIPCAHTTMIAFEKKDNSKKSDKKILKDKRFRRNLLIGVGVVAVIGVAAYAFGDLMASMGGVPVDSIANVGTQGGCCSTNGSCNCGGGDCGDCGNCDAGCCDCNCADGDCGCCGCSMDCAGADCGSCDCGSCNC